MSDFDKERVIDPTGQGWEMIGRLEHNYGVLARCYPTIKGSTGQATTRFSWSAWLSMPKVHAASLEDELIRLSDKSVVTTEFASPLLQEVRESGGAALYREFKRIRAHNGRAIEHWTHLHDDEQKSWDRLASNLTTVPQ